MPAEVGDLERAALEPAARLLEPVGVLGSLRSLAGAFSADRMLREYCEQGVPDRVRAGPRTVCPTYPHRRSPRLLVTVVLARRRRGA
jgi:hypothetical protein